MPVPDLHPALARRPKDRGLPVPYVAAWSSERGAIVLRRERNQSAPPGRRWTCHTGGREGRGSADFASMHPARSREAAELELCQVCATPLAYSGRWLICWPTEHDMDTVGPAIRARMAEAEAKGLPFDCTMVTEPPMCRPCAAYVLTVCPGVGRKAEASPGFRVLSGVVVDKIAVPIDPWAAPFTGGMLAPEPRQRARVMADGGALFHVKSLVRHWAETYDSREEAAAAASDASQDISPGEEVALLRGNG